MNDEGLFQHLETHLSELIALTSYTKDPFEQGYNVARAQALSIALYNQVRDRNKNRRPAEQ